jgi:phosphotriesterase-related protein
MPSDEQRIRWIQSLIQAGYKDQIVIAHDIYTKHRLQTYGGTFLCVCCIVMCVVQSRSGHGYYHILEKIVPRMRRVGIPEDCIDRILVHTPRRLLTLL